MIAKLAAQRHARYEVGARDGANVLLETDLGAGNAALAGAVIVDRTTVEWRGERGKALGALLQLPAIGRHVDAEVVEEENISVPTIGMRYSRLVFRLVSPPMEATP